MRHLFIVSIHLFSLSSLAEKLESELKQNFHRWMPAAHSVFTEYLERLDSVVEFRELKLNKKMSYRACKEIRDYYRNKEDLPSLQTCVERFHQEFVLNPKFPLSYGVPHKGDRLAFSQYFMRIEEQLKVHIGVSKALEQIKNSEDTKYEKTKSVYLLINKFFGEHAETYDPMGNKKSRRYDLEIDSRHQFSFLKNEKPVLIIEAIPSFRKSLLAEKNKLVCRHFTLLLANFLNYVFEEPVATIVLGRAFSRGGVDHTWVRLRLEPDAEIDLDVTHFPRTFLPIPTALRSDNYYEREKMKEAIKSLLMGGIT